MLARHGLLVAAALPLLCSAQEPGPQVVEATEPAAVAADAAEPEPAATVATDPASAPAVAIDPASTADATTGQDPLVTVPALTPVPLRIEDLVSSNKNKPGDHFRITVAEDVRVGDALVVPMGSIGEGEIVHASKSSAGGKAGELILAARYVRVGDVEVRLRSFALGVAGKDYTQGSLVASFVIGPLAMFVRGGVVTVPPGTYGLAKTAQEFKIQSAVPATAATPGPVPQPVETALGGEHESKVE